MIYTKKHIAAICFFVFLFSCKKESKEAAFNHDEELIHEIEHATADVSDALFYDLWKNDSIFVFEKRPEIEKNIVYIDSLIEKEDFATKKILIMRNKHKKIVKLKELEELNDGSLRTELSAYFDNGHLLFIEYLNDMIDEPATSYYIKSAVSENEFDSAHFQAKRRVCINGNMDLPLEKTSTECIFNALVLYDKMKDKLKK